MMMTCCIWGVRVEENCNELCALRRRVAMAGRRGSLNSFARVPERAMWWALTSNRTKIVAANSEEFEQIRFGVRIFVRDSCHCWYSTVLVPVRNDRLRTSQSTTLRVDGYPSFHKSRIFLLQRIDSILQQRAIDTARKQTTAKPFRSPHKPYIQVLRPIIFDRRKRFVRLTL